jgi:hypothetical protein
MLVDLELPKYYCVWQAIGYTFFAGYLTRCALDTVMVPTSPGGPAGAYGYWMQPAADGRTWLLFPGYWMASY